MPASSSPRRSVSASSTRPSAHSDANARASTHTSSRPTRSRVATSRGAASPSDARAAESATRRLARALSSRTSGQNCAATSERGCSPGFSASHASSARTRLPAGGATGAPPTSTARSPSTKTRSSGASMLQPYARSVGPHRSLRVRLRTVCGAGTVGERSRCKLPAMTRFRTVVAAPGAPRLIASSLAARMPIAMTYTAIVLLVLATTGDAGLAGLCAAAFGLVEGVGSPVQGRLVDRFGQPRVLVPAATVYATAIVAVATAAEAGAPGVVLVALAGLCGAGFPIVSSAMRALWPSIVDDDRLSAAYALESVVQTLSWLAGPLLVAVLIATISPAAAVIGTAVLALGGTLAFTSTPASRAWRPTPHEHRSL